MVKPQIIPRIVVIGMVVFLFGAILATLAYIYEMSVLKLTTGHPLFDLFADGFKVGLGAFIGVLSQWASRVFTNAEEAQKGLQREAHLDDLTNSENEEIEKSLNTDKLPR